MMPLKSFYVLQSRLKCSTWNSICWKDICKYNDRSPTYIKQLIHLISFQNIFTRTNQGIHEIKFLFKWKDICRLFFLFLPWVGKYLSNLLCFVPLNITGTLQSEGGVLCSLILEEMSKIVWQLVLRPLKADQSRLEGTSKQFFKFGCKWWRCLDCKQLLPINLKAFQVLKILFYRFARNRTDKRRQSFSTISLKSIRENQSSMNVLKKNAFNKSFVFYRNIIGFKEKQACGRNV